MAEDETETTVMKVRIPQEQRTRLEGVKVLTDATLSGLVSEALEVYFDTLRETEGEGRAEREGFPSSISG